MNAHAPHTSARQLELTSDEFSRLAVIAREDAGLALPDGKRQMVQSRLTRHLRRTGHRSFDDYLALVERHENSREREALISLLTTNVSSFFREDHHFATLAEKVLPPLIAKAKQGHRVRFWSAGCSTGQEPYSLAMQALTSAPDLASYDFRILATDIDREVLKTAYAGIYSAGDAEGIPDTMRARFVEPAAHDATSMTMTQPLRDLITFRRLNLVAQDWPMRGQFDVIFCRNVVIYFDEAVQSSLWPRFASALTNDGWFFLGHSERLDSATGALFDGAGVTTFRKRSRSEGAR